VPLIRRGISPAQTIPNDVDDAAENAAVIDTRNPAWLWKHVLDAVPGIPAAGDRAVTNFGKNIEFSCVRWGVM